MTTERYGAGTAWAGGDRTGAGGAHVYRTSPWLRGVLGLVFLSLAAGAIAVGILDVRPDRGMSVVLAMFAAFTWYFWSLARRRRVIIDERGITLIEWNKPVRLELAGLRGYRRSYSNNAVNLHFETHGPGRPVPVRVLASMDAAFHAWLQRVPELDAPPDSSVRQAAFDRDRRIARAINRVALAVGAFSLLPLSYPPGPRGSPWEWVAAVPFLAPLAALAIVRAGRGRFTIAERGRDDPRPTLFLTFLLPPLAGALRPLYAFETLSLAPLFAAAAVASAVLCALAWLCDTTLRGRRALVLLLVVPLMTLPLSSAVLLVNCAADPSPPEVHATTVLAKIHATGKGGGSFLELAPWEPGMQRAKLRVSRDVFAGAREGGPVTVLTRPGRLGLRWAWVEAGSSPSPARAAALRAPGSGAVDWSRDFAHHRRGRFFDLHYQRAAWDAAAFARVADAFVDLLDRDFVPVRLERRLDVLVLPDPQTFHRYLREGLGIDLTPRGIYLPALGVFATYEDSGLGTFTHEIMHAVVERSLSDCPPWAFEGVPAFFEKFLGYWDGGTLVVQWGYQNPWRLQALGDSLQGLDLAQIVAADRAVASTAPTSAQRLVAVFLWQHGRLGRFLQLVATRDRAGFATYFEAAMQRPLFEIIPLWQVFLAELLANRAEALRIPPSTVYEDRAAFEKAFAELRPWLAPGVSR